MIWDDSDSDGGDATAPAKRAADQEGQRESWGAEPTGRCRRSGWSVGRPPGTPPPPPPGICILAVLYDAALSTWGRARQ